MARLLLVVGAGAAVVVSVACGANTASQERQSETPTRAEALPKEPAAISVPQNPADRSIRRDLNVAIADDADLRHREISFIVSNGDVNVTGTVRTEEERRKINDLAMSISGVKSVANGLRVAE
jgi:osmotically-inducible protein OsmY